jgi:restriction system protein
LSDRVATLRKDDFYYPILCQLQGLGGSASIEELDAQLISQFGFTEEELGATYPTSGALIVPDKISWGRSRLKQAGFLTSGGKGVWVLTDVGREVAAKGEAAVHKAVADAMREYNRNYHAKRRAAASASSPDSALPAAQPVSGSEPAADMEVEEDQAERDWTETLLETLRSMDPSAFERLCQRMLRESGFVRVQVTGKSGDGGIDGHGVLRMNLISFQVLFQCKRYSGSVSAGTVRDFRGAMQGRADKGLIITTGTFTPDARREATRDGAPAIDLIDGEALADLLKSLKLGVRVEQIVSERVTVDPAFFGDI